MTPKQTSLTILAFAIAAGLSAQAATISGKVSGGRGSAVVYVDSIPGKTFPAPDKPVTMDQKSLLFQPHVLVVEQGSTVEFMNDDNVAHNIFWPNVSGNKKDSHNLGTWPKGQTRAFKFEKTGVVPLLCNVHPEMSGFIVVVPTPYHAEADASGAYKIDNVPDGTYNVVAWREGAKPVSKQVAVSGNATADFTVSK